MASVERRDMTGMRETETGTQGSHSKCVAGHICQVPSGRECIEAGCNQAAGTKWGPLWCPEHDKERLDRISASFETIRASLAAGP